jgi:hypothetical protein
MGARMASDTVHSTLALVRIFLRSPSVSGGLEYPIACSPAVKTQVDTGQSNPLLRTCEVVEDGTHLRLRGESLALVRLQHVGEHERTLHVWDVMPFYPAPRLRSAALVASLQPASPPQIPLQRCTSAVGRLEAFGPWQETHLVITVQCHCRRRVREDGQLVNKEAG